jgi:hypothetical protein
VNVIWESRSPWTRDREKTARLGAAPGKKGRSWPTRAGWVKWRVGAMDEKELTRWKKVWRERAVWV